jgi:hypothetical protein
MGNVHLFHLLTLEKFEWVKNLKSPMWIIILEGSDSKDCLDFFVPDVCPVSCHPTCSQEELVVATFCTPQGKGKAEVQAQVASPTSALHIKGKRKDMAPIVESEVRRSTRLQHANNGFKKKV